MKKQPVFTNKTDIRLGFEVECVISGVKGDRNVERNPNFGKFQREIYALKKGVTIGDDGSINTYGYGSCTRSAEIRTRPLPPKDAMEVLKAVFDIVNKYGLTNASCGLHVNISSAHKTKMRNFNPLPFLSSRLWDQILKSFNRSGNTFCRTMLSVNGRKVSKIRIFKNLTSIFDDKYRCVSLCHFGNGGDKSSRIEIRGFGNRDYTKKFDTIARYVKRIERLFKLSCGNTIPLTRTFQV